MSTGPTISAERVEFERAPSLSQEGPDWEVGYPGTGDNGYGGRRMLWRGDEEVLFEPALLYRRRLLLRAALIMGFEALSLRTVPARRSPRWPDAPSPP